MYKWFWHQIVVKSSFTNTSLKKKKNKCWGFFYMYVIRMCVILFRGCLKSNSPVQGCAILIKLEDKAGEEAGRRASLLIWFSTLSSLAVFLSLLSCVPLWFFTAETSPQPHLAQLSTSVCLAYENPLPLLFLLLPLSPPPTWVVDLLSWGLWLEIIPLVLYLFH